MSTDPTQLLGFDRLLTDPDAAAGTNPQPADNESAPQGADGSGAGSAAGTVDDGSGPPQSIPDEQGVAVDDEGHLFVRGRLLVKFRDLPEHQKQQVVASAGAHVKGEIPRIGVKIVELPDQASETAHLRAFRQRAEVEFAELDAIVEPAATPNDPYYGKEWHLAKIAAPSAWDVTTGSSNVIIAILDTGVNSAHQDLASKMVAGWNFYDNNADTSDVYGHGTPVAGTPAALGNNGLGVASPAWGCRIMPVRISDTKGYAYSSTAASALAWAADHGARVANISYVMTDSATVTSAAQYFQSHGGVVTISAGNYATFDATPDNPYVLTVSATDPNDVLATWSSTGNNVDLSAPGVNIYTTTKGGGYGSGSGTSFSAPLVAGLAALVISVNPGLTAPQVQDVLKQSADDLGPAGWDPSYGWGRVNATHAVSLALSTPAGDADTTPPTVSFVAPTGGATVAGTVSVQINAADDVGVASVKLYVDTLLIGTDTASPYTFSWSTTGGPNGTHTLEALAADAAGNSASAQLSVTVANPVDAQPPTVSITSPLGGAKVSNPLSVAAAASDDAGVTKVELYLDGKLVGTDSSAPYSFNVNTKKWTTGAHGLQCKAYDAAGNVGASLIVTAYK